MLFLFMVVLIAMIILETTREGRSRDQAERVYETEYIRDVLFNGTIEDVVVECRGGKQYYVESDDGAFIIEVVRKNDGGFYEQVERIDSNLVDS